MVYYSSKYSEVLLRLWKAHPGHAFIDPFMAHKTTHAIENLYRPTSTIVRNTSNKYQLCSNKRINYYSYCHNWRVELVVTILFHELSASCSFPNPNPEPDLVAITFKNEGFLVIKSNKYNNVVKPLPPNAPVTMTENKFSSKWVQVVKT